KSTMQREKPPEWREKQKGSRGIRRGQRYRLVFQFPIREQYIHYLITNVPLDGLGGEYLEIIEAARDIRVELDAHNYISNILTKLGIDRPSGLTRVMDLASMHPEWHQYVSEVTDWLQPVVSDLMERLPENDTVDIT
ncbi:hypothetical protein M1V48_13310, partial [Escherichia coli]|nr:hypothetical protein [Escherichia coli]MCO4951212.1 hypothetical protein [Escherichia coli]